VVRLSIQPKGRWMHFTASEGDCLPRRTGGLAKGNACLSQRIVWTTLAGLHNHAPCLTAACDHGMSKAGSEACFEALTLGSIREVAIPR
jgi:hypothetical protein